MTSLPEFSSNLTNLITKELDYSEDKKEIVAYAIETALLSILGTLLLIIFGFAINALKAALLTAIFGVLLRRVSGGAHLNTPAKCLVIGALSYSSIGFLIKKVIEYNLINDKILIHFWFTSLILIFFLAPVESENKPIQSEELRTKLKFISVVFVLLSFLVSLISENSLLNVSMCFGIFYQSLTLLPVFNRRGGG